MTTGSPTDSGSHVVLVVEDEPVLRSVVSRGLSAAGLDVYSAATVAEVRQLLQVIRPSILVSDLDLPDGSGLDVLASLDARRLIIPVIFVSAYTRAYRAKLSTRNGVELLEKPVPMDELTKLVRSKLAMPMPAAEARFSLSEYLQIACLGGHSTVLEVRNGPDVLGEVLVHRGEVWSARDAREIGPGALQKLLHVGERYASTVKTQAYALQGDPGPRHIEGNWQGLLLEALRVYDEDGRAARDFSDPVGTAEWNAALSGDPFVEMVDELPSLEPSSPPAAAELPKPVPAPVLDNQRSLEPMRGSELTRGLETPRAAEPVRSPEPKRPVEPSPPPRAPEPVRSQESRVPADPRRDQDSRSSRNDDEYEPLEVWKQRQQSQLPTPDPVDFRTLKPKPEPEPEPATSPFDEAYENGVEALLRKDYPRARTFFEAAARIRPDDRKVKANLLRLKDLGFGASQ